MSNELKYKLFDSTECISEQTMYDYIDKKLSPKEEHLVEKHLLDCDLCTDALEGLHLLKNRNKISTINNEIDKKIEVKEKEAKIIFFNYKTITAIAASIVLLIGAVFFFKFFSSQKLESADMAILNVPTEAGKENSPNKESIVLDSNSEIGASEKEKKKSIVIENENTVTVNASDDAIGSLEQAPAVAQNENKPKGDIISISNTVTKSGEISDGKSSGNYKSLSEENRAEAGGVKRSENDKEKLKDQESFNTTISANQQKQNNNSTGTSVPSTTSPVMADETVFLAKETTKNNSKDANYRKDDSKKMKGEAKAPSQKPETGGLVVTEKKEETGKAETQQVEGYFAYDLDNISNMDTLLVYDLPEVAAQFPGGNDSLMRYISKNFKYPTINKEDKLNGTKIYVQFIIDKDGKVKNTKIVKGINPALDAEALRIVNAMPKWKPAKQADKTVNSRYNLPIQLEIR